jgi:hypothetical protein
MGFVRPFTVRPVSGVWARRDSLPGFARRFAPRLGAAGVEALRTGLFDAFLATFFRAGLPLGLPAPAVRRPVFRPALAFLA